MFDNVPSIYIGINGTTDGNPLTTIKLVTAELEKLKKSFPPGLNAAMSLTIPLNLSRHRSTK